MRVMLNNYNYFIALAEEENISKAAEKLFISHQCLSKYLKNLEQEYHIDFFNRSKKLVLTPAGKAYLDMVRQIQILEDDLSGQLDDIRQQKRGYLRFGTTEGRYRSLVPELLPKFKQMYPDVTLEVRYATTDGLSEMILENSLDIALLNQSVKPHNQLDIRPILEEKMFLVISDNLLKTYFPDRWPACKAEFACGADLREFVRVPFALSKRTMNARETLEKYLQIKQIKLNVICEMTQSDLHFMLSSHDYAASVCWSMYIPVIRKENAALTNNRLNVFPIKDANITNHLMMVTRKGKIFQKYGRDFIRLIQQTCEQYSGYDLSTI